jgi:hypothetical protein
MPASPMLPAAALSAFASVCTHCCMRTWSCRGSCLAHGLAAHTSYVCVWVHAAALGKLCCHRSSDKRNIVGCRTQPQGAAAPPRAHDGLGHAVRHAGRDDGAAGHGGSSCSGLAAGGRPGGPAHRQHPRAGGDVQAVPAQAILRSLCGGRCMLHTALRFRLEELPTDGSVQLLERGRQCVGSLAA